MRLVIPGEPVAQGRPRATRQGRVYDPETSRNYKAYVRYCALDNKPEKPLDNPLNVNIKAYFGIPKSKTKKWKESALKGDVVPTKKPDLSNIVKIVEDSLNGVWWRDDSLIVKLSAEKEYSDVPRVEVTVSNA